MYPTPIAPPPGSRTIDARRTRVSATAAGAACRIAAVLSVTLAGSLYLDPALAAPGELDDTFGNAGRASLQLGEQVYVTGGYPSTLSVAQQSDGKVILAGVVRDYNLPASTDDFLVVRLNADGSLDTTFSGDGWMAVDFGENHYDEAYAVMVQPDGKIVLAGRTFDQFGSGWDLALARLESNGTLDTTFGVDGLVIYDAGGNDEQVSALGRQSDGSLVVAGRTDASGQTDALFARFTPTGQIDTSFGSNGVTLVTFGPGSYEYINALAVQSDDYLVGAGYGPGPVSSAMVAIRLTVDGDPDTGFDGDGLVAVGIAADPAEARAVAIQSDGKIVLAGYADTASGRVPALARLETDGSLDTTFGSGGTTSPDLGAEWNWEDVHAMVLQADGKIVVAGGFNPSDFASAYDLFLARFDTDGTLDTGFGNQGIAIADFGGRDVQYNTPYLSNASARALLRQADGRLFVAGLDSNRGQLLDLARFDATGGGSGGVLSFAELYSYPTEDAGTIAVRIRRTGGATGPVSVQVQLGSSSGTPGAGEGCDFTLPSATVSWTDGDYADKELSITIVNDDYLEYDDSFEIHLVNPVGATVAMDAHVVAIQLDANDTTPADTGNVSIEFQKTVSEGAGSVSLLVTRTGTGQDCVVVAYRAYSGFGSFPAIAGVDFVAVSGLLQFGEGDTATRQIVVPIIDDTVGEADETFSVEAVPGGYVPSDNGYAEVTIQDNDGGYPGQIIISTDYPDYDEESAGPAGGPFVLYRINGSNGIVSVDFTPTSGTATAGTDFVAATQTVTWASGDDTPKLVYVQIIDDALQELNETYIGTISNPTGGADLGSTTTATRLIIDNDTLYAGEFRIYAYTTSMPYENTGQIFIGVERARGKDGAVTVDYSTVDGTAVAPGDYSTRSGTLTFADGQGCDPGPNGTNINCNNEVQTFSIPIIDDTEPEGDETFAVTLSNPTNGATILDPPSIEIKIRANDPLAGSVQMEQNSYTVNEADGTVTLHAVRTGGSLGPVTVDFTTVDYFSATPDSDFTTTAGTLTWADGELGAKDIVVPIINDTIAETFGAEVFGVQLSNVTGGALLEALYFSIVYIVDDELNPGSVYFTDYGVPESVGTLNFQVYRQGGSTGAVSLDYTTTDGTAMAPGDYTTTAGTLSWADGDTSTKTIPIPVINDVVPEPTEGFTLVFSNPTGNLQLPQTTSNISITDNDDPGQVSMDVSAVSIAETAATLTISVTRSGGTAGDVSVTYATTNGTATAGSDYTATSGTLSWVNLESGTKSFPVTLLDDAIEEPNETFAVTLSNPTGSVTIGVPSTTVTILDNDANPGILRFTAATAQASEAAGTIQVDVERFGGSLGPVSIQFATGDGSALAGQDYTSASGTLNWADGEKTNRSFSVPILNETIDEPPETFTVTLSNPTGGATLGTPAVQTVTITNDDSPNGVLALSTDVVSVTEGTQVVLQVQRASGGYGAISVDYATLQSSAIAPDDFTATSGTLSWADGDATDRTITVTTIDDAIDEPVESFYVELSNPTGGASLSLPSTLVNLQDNDLGPTGTLAMAQATRDVAESAGTLSVLVTRTGGQSGPASVDYTTQDFTAIAPDDYAATSGTLTWDDFDNTTKVINVPIVNDVVDEPDELFNVVLSNATGADLNVGAATTGVTILDDDLPPVPGTLSVVGPASVDESGVSVTYTISRSGGSDGEVGVSYATVDGTATAGADYSARSGTLTWADGDSVSQTVTVPILEDAIDEPHETFSLTLTGPTGGATLGFPTATTMILDNDVSGPGALGLVSSVSVYETVGSAVLQVSRFNGFDGAVSVGYATADDSALAGQDYTATSGTLSWGDGEGGIKLITVPIINDSTSEPAVESFSVTLSGPTGGATLGSSLAFVSITDDDVPGTIGFTQTNLVESETAGTIALSVSRTDGSRGEVTVDYATVAGTATAGADFTPTSGTLTWADGDSTGRTITVTLLDDALVEFDEDFTVVLTNPGGSALLGAATATVTLQSDEVPVPGTIRMAASAISVNENAGNASVTVQRTVGSDGAVSIDYATLAGTATAADFTAVSGTLDWPDGDATDRTILVPITDDTAWELDETFAVLLSNPSPGAILADATTTVTIVSDDVAVPGTIAMADAAVTVDETAGTVVLSVTRTGGSDTAVAVNYATAPGTATAADFTATSGTLTWANGDAAVKTITVPITDDTLFEPDEQFTVTLSGVTGGAALGTATTNVTIVSTDPPQRGTLGFTSATASVDETAGSVTLDVTRTGGSDGAVTVDFATADGTALAPADYTAGGDTLSWADGDSATKIITIPIVNDAAWELDETFTVTLSNVLGGATLGTATSTVTIVSDDAPVGGVIAMQDATATVAETAGSVVLTVTRTGGSDGTASVNYATAVGTATAADFTATSGTLTWANGDAAPKTITVPVTDDTAYEADETFTVTLSGLTGAGASLGTATTVVTITSEDPAQPGVLSLASATMTVDEPAGTVTLSVTRTGGSDLPVSVGFATAPGTALSPGDFTATSGTLAWANGDAATKSIVVPIINDSIFEANETFTVTISGETGGATLGAVVTTTVTIVSDDPPRRGTLALTSAAASVNETAGSVGLTVTRSGGSDGAVSVNYATVPGTATTADFTATNGTLTWADGDAAPQVISVPIIDDGLVEQSEAFAVTLSNPGGGAALGTASATVTILDDDILVAPGELSFTTSAATVSETAGTVTLTVERNNGLGGVVSVDYATAAGTATSGADFTSSSGTLTWIGGDATPKTITVPIINDTAYEPDETFTVTLSNPGAGAGIGTATVTVTIQSEDPPPDTTPDPFSFNDVTGVLPGAEVQSNEITVSGINTPAPISIDEGEYSINGGAWTLAAGTVTNGARVRVRVIASGLYDTTVQATLDIGGVTDTFSVRTRVKTTEIVVRAKGGGGAMGMVELLVLGVLALGLRLRGGTALASLLLGCLVLVPVARADEASGLYVSAGLGQSEVGVSAGEAARRIESATGDTVTSLSFDERDTSYHATVGYAFGRHFALEAAYYSFGDTTSEVEAAVFDVDAFVEAMADAIPSNVHGPALMARASWPFAEHWAAHVRAGVISWESEVRAEIVSGGSGIYTVKRDGEDAIWGAALSWQPSSRFSLSLEFTQAEASDPVRSIELGVTWMMGWFGR